MKVGVKLVGNRKRPGRGWSSSIGRHCGAGHKGSKARNRGWRKFGIQNGGQNPFYRMHGKVGFRSFAQAKVKKSLETFDGNYLNARLPEAKELTLALLREEGLIGRKCRAVKVLNFKGNLKPGIGIKFSRNDSN